MLKPKRHIVPKATGEYRAQTALNAGARGILAEVQGGKFQDGFTGSILGSLAASGAGIVGDYTYNDTVSNIIAHAVLGCAIAAAGKGGCASGAIGGAASASLARLVDAGLQDSGLSDKTKDGIIAVGATSGTILIAAATGKDVMTAGNAAANEVLNNYLKHNEVPQYLSAKEQLAACQTAGGDCSTQQKLVSYWESVSQTRDAEIRNCQQTGTCQQKLAEVQADMQALAVAKSQINTQRSAVYNQGDQYTSSQLSNVAQSYQDQINDINNVFGASYQSLFANARSEYMATHPGAGSTDFNKVYGYNLSGVTVAAGVLGGGLAAGRGLGNGGDSVAGVGVKGVGSAADNIYNSMRPMAAEFPELNGVNPHYVENAGQGINTNCVSCVNATQQRLTGQTVDAVADATKYSNQNGLLPSAPFGFGPTTTPAVVIDEMIAAGNGAARPLIIQQPGNVQHVINVVNRNGQVYFIDSQMGQVVTLYPTIPVKLGRP